MTPKPISPSNALVSPDVCLWVILSIHGGLLAFMATRDAPTIDEPFHVAAGMRRLTEGKYDIDRGNPPLHGNIAALPSLFMDLEMDWHRVPATYEVGLDFLNANGDKALRAVWLGRMMLIPVSILGGFICFVAARDIYGPEAGLIACFLWCLSPNILGNGHLVTGDVTATVTGLLAAYLLACWLRSPKLWLAVAVGVAVGAAELSKYVWVVFVPIIAISWLVVHSTDRAYGQSRSTLKEMCQLLLIAVIAVQVIHIGYSSQGTLSRLDSYRLGRRLASHLPAWGGRIPVPLPRPYVQGVDEISGRVEAAPSSYVRGQWKKGGTRWYYAYCLSVKIPDSLLIMLCIGAGMFARKSLWRGEWTLEVTFAVSFVVILVFVSRLTSGQRFRYALPVMPYLFIQASRCAVGWTQSSILRKRCVLAFTLLFGVQSALTFPYSLSYFNFVSGGPLTGHAHLVDSNLDWGQDLYRLREWVKSHPEVSKIGVAYFGCLSPERLDIEFELPPGNYADVGEAIHVPFELQGPQPGWYAVSVSYVRGAPWRVPNGEYGFEPVNEPRFSYFREFEPIERIGYSIYVYHLDEEEVKRVRTRLGLPSTYSGDQSTSSEEVE